MRKIQKEQAENIIGLLGRVHTGIKKAIEQGRYESAMELLSQCQESAIELGETIEEIEGEGFVTVSFLENYCETVYQCYALVSQAQNIHAGKVYKNLNKALVPVENSVKNDISVRREAVFLPYKASMWDSLESVWKAADEDPECDAYVIPIPYYDKNPDGSFREMHYEGDQYPDYVPVTSYEKFDFEEHHPDMIFIHNPYDECNYVTSVHPFFYAKNLKQLTDKLVYIPYFILDEIDPENKEAVKGMAHFCTLPGVLYADQVIVQSEKMRQVYVDVMTEFFAGGIPGRAESTGRKISETANRKYWEEKILGLGSPKVDKVLNTKKEDLEIPEEWLQIIEKPDGSWKKIIFYNTSVTALLEHGEKMLEKMRDVFRVFEENKDEVALLWRPHPLIRATIESMRPQLWEEYEKIVGEYRTAGWGIYDDSADVDRAVILSDGYYGDGSSVAKLCNDAGVLVAIQNLKEDTKKEFNKLVHSVYGIQRPGIVFMAKVDDYLYFVPTDFNALFSIDLCTGSCDLKCVFVNEKIKGDFLGNVFSYGKDIIISPFGFTHFHVWNTEESQQKYIPKEDIASTDIGKSHRDYEHPAYLPRMIAVENKLIFVPSYSKDLYSINIGTWKSEKLFGIYRHFTEVNPSGYSVFSRDPGYVFNNKIYFSMSDADYIAEYDIHKNAFRFCSLNLDEQIILSTGSEECLYMLSEKGKLYEWNIENHRLTLKAELKCDNYDILRLQSVAKYEDSLYYMAPNDRFGIRYDLTENKMEIGDYKELFKFADTEESEYHFSLQDLEGILYFISENYELLIYDLKSKEYKCLNLYFNENQIKNLWNLQKVKVQNQDKKGDLIYKAFQS